MTSTVPTSYSLHFESINAGREPKFKLVLNRVMSCTSLAPNVLNVAWTNTLKPSFIKDAVPDLKLIVWAKINRSQCSERNGLVPPIRAESVLMALTKGWPEPTEPDWSTTETEKSGGTNQSKREVRKTKIKSQKSSQNWGGKWEKQKLCTDSKTREILMHPVSFKLIQTGFTYWKDKHRKINPSFPPLKCIKTENSLYSHCFMFNKSMIKVFVSLHKNHTAVPVLHLSLWKVTYNLY